MFNVKIVLNISCMYRYTIVEVNSGDRSKYWANEKSACIFEGW